jgi:hypothetical protein
VKDPSTDVTSVFTDVREFRTDVAAAQPVALTALPMMVALRWR